MVGGAFGALALATLSGCATTKPSQAPYTVDQWRRERGSHFFIGHRGVADVVPEHTLESYEAALRWGARALEISVVRTSDRVLICNHDLTFDRTTTLKGTVASQPSTVLEQGRVDIPRLGPRWQGDGRPRIARFEDVLDRIGRRAVLCVEAKDDSAFPDVLDAVEKRGLKASTIVKLDYASNRLPEAKGRGYPVFRYIGNFAEATPERITAVAAELDPRQDCLVLPSNENAVLLADDVLAAGVSTGVPVWLFDSHRRYEVERHFAHGAVGSVTSSIGYVSGTSGSMTTAGWPSGMIASGEMTRRPESPDYGLVWLGSGVVRLAIQGRQAFVCLGQLAPLADPHAYRLDLEVRVDRRPSVASSNVSVAFGHADDSYYEHRLGAQNGYHALLRLNGSLELWSHEAGRRTGTALAAPVATAPPREGQWVPLRLEVTETGLTWTRRDTGDSVRATDGRYRGDFLHVGRSAPDGEVSLAGLSVS